MTEVTQERAAMLAAHAIHVQGGFSTPEIEKARAEQQLAAGGSINWAQMEHEVVDALKAKLETLPPPAAPPQEEVEAQELEGLAPMPPELVALRERKLEIDKLMGDLKEELDGIKGKVDEELTARGLQGFTLHGAVKARKSPGTRSSVDAKKLKEEMPAVYQKYLRVTKYFSIRIT